MHSFINIGILFLQWLTIVEFLVPTKSEYSEFTEVTTVCQESTKADIIFVLDGSNCIGDDHWGSMIHFTSAIVKQFSYTQEEVQFALVYFEGRQPHKYDFRDMEDVTAVVKTLQSLPYAASRGSFLHKALRLVMEQDMFSFVAGSRPDAEHVLIVMTDGMWRNAAKTLLASEELKKEKVIVLTVGVGPNPRMQELSCLASCAKYVFRADCFELILALKIDLTTIRCKESVTTTSKSQASVTTTSKFTPSVTTSPKLTTSVKTTSKFSASVTTTPKLTTSVTTTSKLTASVTTTLKSTAPVKTSHKFTASVTLTPKSTASVKTTSESTSSLTTSPRPTTPPCDETVQLDVIFVLDSSSSIGANNWNYVKKAAAEITLNFHIGSDRVRFGCITFNRRPTKVFDLKTHNRTEELYDALINIKYPFITGTHTHRALDLIMTDEMFSDEAGGRDLANNVVVVVTDGMSDFPNSTIRAATELKDTGVTIISVGVGQEPSLQELQDMASSPELVIMASDFKSLEAIKDDLVSMICPKKKEVLDMIQSTVQLPPK